MFGLSLKRVEEIEQLATMVWRRNGGSELPVRTRSVFEQNAIFLHHLAATTDLDAIFDLTSPHGPYHLSLRDRRGDEDEVQYRHRMRFTEGHELGHFFLHLGLRVVHRENFRTVVAAVESGNFKLAEIEIEANAFGGAFLMPRETILSDLAQVRGGERWLHTLAVKYNVSLEALRMRIARLRPGLFLSGHAFAEDGTIIYMVPSLELEQQDPRIASDAWRCYPHVQDHVVRKLPPSILRVFWERFRGLHVKDIALVRSTTPGIPLAVVLPDSGNGTSCEVHLSGYCKNEKGMIYFEVELSSVNIV